MRTVVLLGLMAIANAINKDWCRENDTSIYGMVFVASIIMDIVEFINN